MNKIIVSIMTMIMLVMSMSILAVAAPGKEAITASNAHIEIKNKPSTTGVTLDGKAFNLYRVFDVTINRTTDASGTVSDSIEYAVNAEFKGFFDAELSFEGTAPAFGSHEYVDAALDYVHAFKPDADTDTMQELVTKLRTYALKSATVISTASATSATGTGDNLVQTVTSDVLVNGYYLVVDSEATADKSGLVPAGALVNVPSRSKDDGTLSANAVINMKGSKPTMNKEVWHDNIGNVAGDNSPEVGDKGSWDVVADYQIGDTVEYRITATIPKNIEGYDAYTYIISDKLSSGITMNKDSLKIFKDASLSADSEVQNKYHEVKWPATDAVDGPTFEIEFDMLGIVNDTSLKTIDKFYIYYTGTVTKDALVAMDYENNVATLEFSNNPYDSESKDKIKDEVQTYTFALDIFKTQGDGSTPLAGAIFALYSIAGEGAEPVQISLARDESKTDVPTYYLVKDGAASDTAGVDGAEGYLGTITTDDNGKFRIVGLDDATEYKLKEVLAPEGYNAADSIYFVIDAEYTEDANGVSVPKISTTSDLGVTDSGLSGTVINTSSTLLPTTGGMGTQIFMILGGVLMAGAVVLLVVKRKKEA